MNSELISFLGVFLIRSTLILSLAIGLILMLRRAEPRWRVFVARAAVLTLPLLLLAGMMQPRIQLPLLKPADPVPTALVAMGASPGPEIDAGPVIVPEALAAPRQSIPWWALVLAIFTLGVLLHQGLRIASYSSGLVRHRTRPAGEDLQSLWCKTCREAGTEAMEVRLSEEGRSPWLTCGWRSILVMPVTIAENSEDNRLLHALRHEAEHLAHRDQLWIPGFRLVASVFWFHPLVWCLGALHQRACEEACDAAAARKGSPEEYATSLASLALELIPIQQATASLIRRHSVLDRLRSVERHSRLCRPGKIYGSMTAFAAGALAVMLGLMTLVPSSVAEEKREDLLKEVEEGWEESRPESATEASKALSLVIASVEYKGATLAFVINDLEKKSAEGGRSLSIHFEEATRSSADTEIYLKLSRVPIVEALRYATQLAQVDYEVREDAVYIIAAGSKTVPQPEPEPATTEDEETRQRLHAMIVPSVDLKDMPFRAAIEFLNVQANELAPDSRGANLIIHAIPEPEPLITLRLTNVPWATALDYVCELGRATWTIEDQQIRIRFTSDQEAGRNEDRSSGPVSEAIGTRAWSIPAEVMEAQLGFFGKSSVEDLLEELGVNFSESARMLYEPEKGRLVLRARHDELSAISHWANAIMLEKMKKDLGGKPLVLVTMVHELPKGSYDSLLAQHGVKSEKELLGALGVLFPEGAAALYEEDSERIIVRNVESQQDRVKELISLWNR